MRAASVLLFVACYAPATPSGVPCATGSGPRCPGDQVCVQQGATEVCVRPGDVPVDAPAPIDAEPDGSPFVDSDGDMVPDSTDNCRTTPNASQYDEDADALGDACDPCPPIAANTDGDGDGVGDACDPNPMIAGDTLVLFEGFNTAVPDSWNRMGTWTFQNGAAAVMVANDARAYLAPPLAPDMTGTASAAVMPLAVGASNQHRSIGVTDPLGLPGALAGIECQLFTDGNARRFGLYNVAQDNTFESTSLAWAVNTRYVVRQQRTGDSYRCTVDDQVQEDSSSSFVLGTAAIAVRTQGISGSFAWLMYVESP